MPPVAILAGGLATRLHPVTATIPKALLDIAGQPFIVRQLQLLRERDIDHVVLCVGFLGEQIEALVGDGRRYHLHVAYSYDGEPLLGTGGALRKALPLLGEEFFILYGDSYLETDYQSVYDAFRRSGHPGLMTVYRNRGQFDTSNIVYRDHAILVYDKTQRIPDMEYIDYGLSILRADVLAGYPDNTPFDIAEVYASLVAQRRMAALEVGQRFYEIGKPEGLSELRRRFDTLQE